MNTVFNTNLFKHREVNTEGFNNLCTIIHPITEEGTYYGDVFMNKQHLGHFRLECTESSENKQLNMNLSHFDPLYAEMLPNVRKGTASFTIKPKGALLFHATEHHNGLYVKMEKGDTKSQPVFDSRSLMKGDLVAFRPIAAGNYLLSDGRQEIPLKVRTAEEGKYFHPNKLKPTEIKLDEKGFSDKEISIQPLQTILVHIEKDSGALQIRSKPEKSKNNL